VKWHKTTIILDKYAEEVIVVYFKALSCHLPEKAKKIIEKLQSEGSQPQATL
jgi:hypothetical protein